MTSCKVKELSAILVQSPRPMGINARLITIPISSSRCIQIPPRLQEYLAGELINHRLERGMECVLLGEITRLSRSIDRDQGSDTQGMTNP